MSLLRNLPLIAALALTPIVGCSKSKNESSVEKKISSGSLLDDSLLKKIPDTTAGFFILDFAGEGYTKLNSTPWASEVRGLSSIKAAIEKMESRGANEDQVRLMKAVFKSLQKLGLVSSEGRSQVEKVFSSSVAFIAIRKNESLPLDIGIFVSAAKGTNLAEKLPALKGICAEADLKVVDKRIGGAEGFSATFKPTGEVADELSLFVAASPELLSITLHEDSAASLFSGENTKGLQNLQAHPDFAKINDSIGSSESPLALSFLSLTDLLPGLLASNGIESSPLPISAIGFNQGYTSHMATTLGVGLSPNTEDTKRVAEAFQSAELPKSAFRLPSDTAFSLSLDTRILNRLQSLIQAGSDPAVSLALQQLKNIEAITVGLRNSDGASPIPDVFIEIESADPAQVSGTLESGIDLGMMSAGQQAQWLSKSVAGAPTRFVMTPLGVGLYIASPSASRTVVMASSERAISDIVSLSTSGRALEDSMSKALRENIGSPVAGTLYINCLELAKVIDTVKKSAVSMLGPSPELEQALDSERIKKLGVGINTLSFVNGVFKFRSVFEHPDTP